MWISFEYQTISELWSNLQKIPRCLLMLIPHMLHMVIIRQCLCASLLRYIYSVTIITFLC